MKRKTAKRKKMVKNSTIEDEYIFFFTGKSTKKVLNTYDLKELMHLSKCLLFFKHL